MLLLSNFQDLVVLLAPCVSHVDHLFVLYLVVYFMSLCTCCFCHSRHVVLSLRSVTGEIWCGVNCCCNVLSIVVQFAHFGMSLVVYCCWENHVFWSLWHAKFKFLHIFLVDVDNFKVLCWNIWIFNNFPCCYSWFAESCRLLSKFHTLHLFLCWLLSSLLLWHRCTQSEILILSFSNSSNLPTLEECIKFSIL